MVLLLKVVGGGENYPLEIGSGSFVPGFEDQLIGMGVDKEQRNYY